MNGSDRENGAVDVDGRVLRLPAVMERTGLSKASIYRLIKAGDFPAAIRLTSRAVGWLARGIDEWIASRDSVCGDSARHGAGRRRIQPR